MRRSSSPRIGLSIGHSAFIDFLREKLLSNLLVFFSIFLGSWRKIVKIKRVLSYSVENICFGNFFTIGFDFKKIIQFKCDRIFYKICNLFWALLSASQDQLFHFSVLGITASEIAKKIGEMENFITWGWQQ